MLFNFVERILVWFEMVEIVCVGFDLCEFVVFFFGFKIDEFVFLFVFDFCIFLDKFYVRLD